MMGDKRKDATKGVPGEEARQHGKNPTGRSDEDGQGRESGVVADQNRQQHEKAQEAELEMNEENR